MAASLETSGGRKILARQTVAGIARRLARGSIGAFASLLGRNHRVVPEGARQVDLTGKIVLVLMVEHLGDTIIHYPLLSALAETSGAKALHVCVKRGIDRSFSAGRGWTVWPFACPWTGGGRGKEGLADWLRIIRQLRAVKPDIVVSTQAHTYTALTARLVTNGMAIGFDADGSRLLTHRIDLPPAISAHRRVAALMAALGLKGRTTGAPRWTPFAPDAAARGRTILAEAGGGARAYVCLHPGAGGAAKVWPAENFARLALETELGRTADVVLLGGPLEADACRVIGQALAGQRRVIDLSGRLSVAEMYGVMAGAAFYVGNDSGPTHLAAYAGIPVFTLFGPPTIPAVWRPAGDNVVLCHLPGDDFWTPGSVPQVRDAFEHFLAAVARSPDATEKSTLGSRA